MAALFKNNFQISKLSLANLGYPLRYFSSKTVQNVQNCSVVPLWSHKVNNFGNLRVFSGNFGVHVTASNSYGEQTAVGVSFVSDCKDVLGVKKDLGAIRECVCCNVAAKDDGLSLVTIQTDANKILQSFKPTLLDKTKLLIELPHSYELFLNSSSQLPITVEKLECDNIEIHTEGNCMLSQLKSQLITVSSVSGAILSESSLIGDLALTTSKSGGVSLGKIQGNNIKIVSENGDVRVASLYGGDVLINTEHGNVSIGDVHGNIEVTTKSGDINCGSISGHLKAVTEDGNIEAIKLTSGGNVIATSLNGNATVKLDSDLKCRLELSSKTMNISPDLNIVEKSEQIADDLITFSGQTQGEGEHYAKVICHKGNIDLLQESWFVMP